MRPLSASASLGLIATFVAMGGTAYATSSLPPNSVGTAQLRRDAVTLDKISPGAIGTAKIRRHAVTLAKISPAAVRALQGRMGPAGPAGPSDGYYSIAQPVGGGDGEASVAVPPGNYIAYGGCTASQDRMSSQSSTVPAFGQAQAFLTTGPVFSFGPFEPGTVETEAAVPNMGANIPPAQREYGSASLSNSSGFTLPSGGTISELCRQFVGPTGNGSSDQPVQISNTYVTAIRVEDVNQEENVPPAG